MYHPQDKEQSVTDYLPCYLTPINVYCTIVSYKFISEEDFGPYTDEFTILYMLVSDDRTVIPRLREEGNK